MKENTKVMLLCMVHRHLKRFTVNNSERIRVRDNIFGILSLDGASIHRLYSRVCVCAHAVTHAKVGLSDH